MRPSADTVLRRHAIERMRQGSIPSRDMEQTLTLVRDECEPRMSSEAWVESCLLTKGVDERLWDVLACYFAGWDEGAPARMTQEATPPPRFSPAMGDTGAREWAEAGQPGDAVITSVCASVTFQMACAAKRLPDGRAKEPMGYAEGRKMRYAALLRVAENIAGTCVRSTERP